MDNNNNNNNNNNNVKDRLTFLAELFDVFESGKDSLLKKTTDLTDNGYGCSLVGDDEHNIIAIISEKQNGKERFIRNVSVSSDVFSAMIVADPTTNKMYLQWMLTIFVGLLKQANNKTSIESAIRFVSEDLPQANKYLVLFDENKRKKKFKELCKASYTLLNVEDPTNINQYKSLSMLFDAVDPFIVKEPSSLERTLYKFVELGQAVIPVKDRNFTLYMPKTTEASVVFSSFANWCTARDGNGMFNSYINQKKPNGKNSDIYIIINNKFFTGESEELYQLHFESRQIKNKANDSNVNIFDDVLSKSDGITNFFKEELMAMAKEYKKGLENNIYLNYLIEFGFAESLFEMLDVDTPTIRIMTREIPRLPDISRFKSLDQLIITDAKLVDLHPSIGNLTNLEIVALTGNRIKSLPREIGNLKKLSFLNLTGNPICDIPEEIKYLDKSNGGSLVRIGVRQEEIGEENYQKLKRLLPTTSIN